MELQEDLVELSYRLSDEKKNYLGPCSIKLRIYIMTTRYQPAEILQIFQANYRQQQQFDDMVIKDQELSFDTTIFDWRDSSHLLPTRELWPHLNDLFQLELDKATWMTVLEPEDDQTLGDLCRFLAGYSKKEVIEPIPLFGHACQTAALFRSLKTRLANRGVDVKAMRPSSPLEPLMKIHGGPLINEINLLDPTVLPPIDFKMNWIYTAGLRAFIFFLLITIVLACVRPPLVWISVVLCALSYGILWLSIWIGPRRARFEGIETIADLIRRMEAEHKFTAQTKMPR